MIHQAILEYVAVIQWLEWLKQYPRFLSHWVTATCENVELPSRTFAEKCGCHAASGLVSAAKAQGAVVSYAPPGHTRAASRDKACCCCTAGAD